MNLLYRLNCFHDSIALLMTRYMNLNMCTVEKICDASGAIISQAVENDKRIKLCKLSRNFGDRCNRG